MNDILHPKVLLVYCCITFSILRLVNANASHCNIPARIICLFFTGWSWHGSVLIPALLFLTPVQSDPLSIARRAGPAQACLGSKPRSTGEGVWSKPSYAPHPTPSSLPTPLLSPKSKNPAPYNLLSSLIQLNSGPTERLLLFTFFTSEGESLQQKGMTSCSPF